MDAIVFDWDGTLCDSLPAIYEANRIVLEELGLPFDDARYRAAYVPDWRLMYQRLGVPDGALDEAGRRWLALYAEAAEAGLLRACGNPSSAWSVPDRAGPRDRRRPGRGERPARAVRYRSPDPGAGLRHRRDRLEAAPGPAVAGSHGARPCGARRDRPICRRRPRRHAHGAGRGRGGDRDRVVDRAPEVMLEAERAPSIRWSPTSWTTCWVPPAWRAMSPDRRKAIVLATGRPRSSRPGCSVAGMGRRRDAVVAADGGARHAAAFGLRVARWVGDGDSIGSAELDALAASGVSIGRVPAEKDESDAELALVAAVDGGATEIVVLGALGGPRVDHALANVGLLAHPALDGAAGLPLRRARRADLAARRARARVGVRAGRRPSMPGERSVTRTLVATSATSSRSSRSVRLRSA